ncbi:DNA polymerase III subunits gamma and tau [Streptococcus pyogenes]|uniref:DNA polymerase III subunit gamma/tau n=1 Tax=Streptococcus pyogenes TaxID=1314 RepID=UPI00109D6C9A|nr:DNA polymerase III subunit gamma/tau [Streptococcus pyogenes]VGX71063.1 DNA polymerase III subunits gamma and tau [Streptococcus pyogenes]VGZ16189.1 DNA polymerase III subunits gamma and tau [Streptococcus pyogenes]VGZ16432.1 DNA polymerase III subunits gamma and tau [Streptococcus pyogenes]VHF08688.1 DNA polymerase III subunits gamma and tau [Streptococcus pyogenes]VHG29060.1 DNA polymerase III subunits gamma and tau [Streptococcus pyogenes]
MYQALYRKYRSQTFDEMVGQSVISTTLKQAVESGKISHAYLFSGPRGTGKTSAAKIFAKAMNCPNQVDGEPCNQCDICRDITNGSLEDVIEIDAASNNGVDEIRDIRDKSTYAPSRATYKVYIIDEVHMLSTGAFNALLKTLEEPTENVVFILATTELHKIPATILSRVQRFEFKAIKQKAIREHLAWVLDKEGIAYEVDALNLIARRAEGGMRDALSILDQALSLSPDNQVTIAIAEEITGSISMLALGDYVRYVSQEQATQALAALETIYDSGKSMSRFATDLLTYLRDLLVVKAGGDNQRQSAVFDTNLSLSIDRIFQMITVVTSHLPEIKKGTHPRIYAEMMTIQLAQKEQILSQANLSGELISEIETLKNELAQLKQQLSQLQSRPDSLARSDKTKPKTASYRVDRVTILKIMEETVRNSQQSRQYLDALKNAWNEILDNISAQDRALLMGSEPVLANSENAILAFEAAFNAEQVMSRNNLNDMFGNIMSKAAGFSPNILAVPRTDFQHIRKEFAQQMKSQKDSVQEEQEVVLDIPEGFDFLLDKINTIDD